MNLAAHIAGLAGREIPTGAGLMQRGYADIIEDAVSRHVIQSLSDMDGVETREASSKRSIEDFSILEGGNTIHVDIKSRDIDGQFSMPNLISVDRLRRFYASPSNSLVYLFVDYEAHEGYLVIKSVTSALAEELDISCLQVQNLGKGQLQLRQGLKPALNQGYPRQKWMQEIVALVVAFHKRQLEKTQAELDSWMALASD